MGKQETFMHIIDYLCYFARLFPKQSRRNTRKYETQLISYPHFN